MYNSFCKFKKKLKDFVPVEQNNKAIRNCARQWNRGNNQLALSGDSNLYFASLKSLNLLFKKVLINQRNITI